MLLLLTLVVVLLTLVVVDVVLLVGVLLTLVVVVVFDVVAVVPVADLVGSLDTHDCPQCTLWVPKTQTCGSSEDHAVSETSKTTSSSSQLLMINAHSDHLPD